MNYVEFHVNDWDADTRHLSILEDGVYGRMVRLYYRSEQPLPADVAEVCWLVGAKSKAERTAVDVVLNHFFELTDDGWRHARCDEVIEAYVACEPERQAKRENEKARMKRYRDERAKAYAELRAGGVVLPWNAPMTRVRELLKECRARQGHTVGGDLFRSDDGHGNGPATDLQRVAVSSPATPATATHSPIPNTQYNTHTTTAYVETGGVCVSVDNSGRQGGGDRAGSGSRDIAALCRGVAQAMASQGLDGVSASEPELRVLVEAGVPRSEFEVGARLAVSKGKGLAFALGVARNRHADTGARSAATGGPALQGVAGLPDWSNVDEWSGSRTRVVERAISLGMPAFNVADELMGAGPKWGEYKAGVIEAHQRLAA